MDTASNQNQANDLEPNRSVDVIQAIGIERPGLRKLQAADRANIVLEIQESMAISMLRDAREWLGFRVPKPGTVKRLNWDKSRQIFVSTFRELFGLDDKAAQADRNWGAHAKPANVYDVSAIAVQAQAVKPALDTSAKSESSLDGPAR